VAGLPDVDSRDHLSDELQVHLRGDHAGRETAARDGHRHVGLGPVAEVDRAEVGGAELRGEEPPLAGVIVTAVPDVEIEAGHAELLAAGPVEVTHVGHRGHVTEHAREVEVRRAHRL
jgi:hypothetical protein